MQTCVALLRGINVGGKNRLPMKELRELLTHAGLNNVQTYIQSGNVIFQTDKTDLVVLTLKVQEVISENFGFKPAVFLLWANNFLTGIENNPYPEAEEEPKTLHLFFLSAPPTQADIKKLNELKKETERFTLKDNVFYLHAPEGIGRSILASRAESALGVPVTARNWRTCQKIKALIEAA